MAKPIIGQFTFRQVIFYIAVTVFASMLVFIASIEVNQYTESTAFCTSCHPVMDPEAATYRVSPHADVQCGTCHIGPGGIQAVRAKFSSLRYLWEFPTGRYPRPIPSPVTSLRPARVTCEQCHWPQIFYTDRLVQIQHYARDEANTPTSIYLLLKTGGGSRRLGLGKGIHWHIENEVYYIATDEKRQEIPWVQTVINSDITEYLDVDSNLSQEQIAKIPKRKMDCLDCHNRATHIFRSPEAALDQAISQGRIKADLPFIKNQSLALLDVAYASQDKAAAAITEQLPAFYQERYPELYSARQGDITHGITTLQDIYSHINFPEMRVDWQTHPDNIGHKDFPGCFRCHDGKHLSASKQAVRLECNICHTIPAVALAGQPVPTLMVSRPEEPSSHKSTIWLSRHRFAFDQTCAACHNIGPNPGGVDNTGFCSNYACHGIAWRFAGLNAPAVRALSALPGEPSSPMIPHPLEGREGICLTCHGEGGVLPVPKDHAGRTNEMCLSCHKPAGP